MRKARITIYVDFDEELEVPDVAMDLNGGTVFYIWENKDIAELYYINRFLTEPFNENR